MANDPHPIAPDMSAMIARIEQRERELKSGGGGGTYDGMDSRVTRLEVHLEHMREDVAEVKSDLKAVLASLRDMPTKGDLWSWKLQWTAIGIGLVALIVGGIIGGLAWIQPGAAPPNPIVVTLPK